MAKLKVYEVRALTNILNSEIEEKNKKLKEKYTEDVIFEKEPALSAMVILEKDIKRRQESLNEYRDYLSAKYDESYLSGDTQRIIHTLKRKFLLGDKDYIKLNSNKIRDLVILNSVENNGNDILKSVRKKLNLK